MSWTDYGQVCSLAVDRPDVRLPDDLPEAGPQEPGLATVLPGRVLSAQLSELDGQRILLGYQVTSSRMTLTLTAG